MLLFEETRFHPRVQIGGLQPLVINLFGGLVVSSTRRPPPRLRFWWSLKWVHLCCLFLRSKPTGSGSGAGSAGNAGTRSGSHRASEGRASCLKWLIHGCCWETFYIFAYSGLVGNPQLTA